MKAALVLAAVLMGGCRTPDPWQQTLGSYGGDGAREIRPGLVIGCSPGEAEVVVDGVLQGSCADLEGRVLSLQEGTHRVEVKKAGLIPYEATVATGRARTKLQVQLSAGH